MKLHTFTVTVSYPAKPHTFTRYEDTADVARVVAAVRSDYQLGQGGPTVDRLSSLTGRIPVTVYHAQSECAACRVEPVPGRLF